MLTFGPLVSDQTRTQGQRSVILNYIPASRLSDTGDQDPDPNLHLLDLRQTLLGQSLSQHGVDGSMVYVAQGYIVVTAECKGRAGTGNRGANRREEMSQRWWQRGEEAEEASRWPTPGASPPPSDVTQLPRTLSPQIKLQ